MPLPRFEKPSGRPWYEIRALSADEAEIYIYEEIGESWYSESKSAKQFLDELRALGPVTQINLHINSPGGSVFDGVAIYNSLRNHAASVTTYVDGYAASIASIVALAGNTVIMPSNSMLMIHSPWSIAIGNAAEMRQVAESLDKIREAMLTTYMARSTKSEGELIAALDAETWLTAADAQEWGFADEITAPLQAAALGRFDISAFGYRHIPAALAEPPEDDSVPVAVGRTLSAENESKIISARDYLNEVLDSADSSGGGDSSTGADETAEGSSGDSASTMESERLAALIARTLP